MPESNLLSALMSRRMVLKGGLAGMLTAVMPTLPGQDGDGGVGAIDQGFTPLTWSDADAFEVAAGYTYEVVIRWGDPVLPGAPAWDPRAQSGAAQVLQCGYNHDFVGFIPLPSDAAQGERGLICLSFEYTNAGMMFPGLHQQQALTREQVDVCMAAHGMAVIMVQRDGDGSWNYDPDSPYNTRIHMGTPIMLSGPAAGDAALQTADDHSGRQVLGSLNNCSGGVTPWGTWLQAEENFNNYFVGEVAALAQPLRDNYARLGMRPRSQDAYGWAAYYDRFDINKEPNEGNRFGWVVEIDPLDPQRTPIKRTALGRFKHEAAASVIAPSGKAVVYSGDDEAFEFLYKFVSAGRVNREDRQANWGLLDKGTLYVARFHADGSGQWLPLIFDQGPLTRANGWQSQADVLIRAREAGSALGATRMDRPEDVEPHPSNGIVYVALTNNYARDAEDVDAANPRGPNKHGHIIEIREHDAAADATRFTWEVLLLCGPHGADSDYQGHDDASPLSCPDNLAFDGAGHLWIATDGQIKTVGKNDGIYQVPLSGRLRGRAKQLVSGLPGGEMCGPCLTPDDSTLFCAVQHPGADVRGSHFEQPATRWPDYQDGIPPRPALVAVRRIDGGLIGS